MIGRPRSRLLAATGVALAIACPGAEATAADDGFARAVEPRDFRFPEDHGSHPEYSTEWWYLTGHLTTAGGDRLGFQATWFRRALTPSVAEGRSPLAVRDVVLFHGGLTDVARQAFHSESATARAAAGWAGASEGALEVWLLDDRLDAAADGSWRAHFAVDGRQLDLALRPTREPLLHGEVPGLSRKGPAPGEASYYVSQTRLQVAGTVERQPGGPPEAVTGQAWFDHEVFSEQLAAGQVGWDWLSVALDDGTDLMLFHLRTEDGGLAPTSSGTLRTAGGERRHLALADFRLEALDRWRAPATPGGGEAPEYPSRWRVEVPSDDLELEVVPLVADQEHRDEGPGGMAYWEGLCCFTGTRRGGPVSGLGYVELVGYRGRGPSGL